MAYEYRVAPIDLEGVAKVFSDELYRNAQLQQKRQQMLDSQFDNEFKMYSGKVRKQDLGEFESLFAEYKNEAKRFQNANRGRMGNVTDASVGKESAKNRMLNYLTESAQLGEYGKNLNNYRTQAKQLVDRDILDSTLADATMLTTTEFKEKYGGLDKAPKPQDFEWKPEKYDDTDNQINIKRTLFFKPESSLNMMPAVEQTGKRKTMPFSFNVNGVEKTYDVPVMTVTANPNPVEVLDRVQRTSFTPSINNFYKWNKDRLLNLAQDSSNPSLQQQAQKVLSFASNTYQTDVDKLSPEQIYAASFMNPDRPSSFEVPDFKYLNQQMKAEMQELNKLKANKAIQKLNQDINQTMSEFGIKTAQKYVTLYEGMQRIGATSNEAWMNQFAPIFEAVGLPVDEETRKSMYNQSIQEKTSKQFGTGGYVIPNLPQPSIPGRKPSILPKAQ